MNHKFRMFEIDNDEPDFSMMEDESLTAFANEIEEDLSNSGWLVDEKAKTTDEESVEQLSPDTKSENEHEVEPDTAEEKEPNKEATSVESSLFWHEEADEIPTDSFEEKEINLVLSEPEDTKTVEFSLVIQDEPENEEITELHVEELAEEFATENEKSVVEADATTSEPEIEDNESDDIEAPQEKSSVIEGAADDAFYHHFGEMKFSETLAPTEDLPDSFYINYDITENDIAENNKTTKKPSIINVVLSWTLTIVVAFLIAIVVNIFIIRPSEVSGESMKPTLQHGDTVILSRVPYMFSSPNRGDIVVIDSRIPEKNEEKRSVLTLFSEALQHNIITKFCGVQEPDYFWIKRVIGVPGDEIEFRDNCVYRNGEALQETYTNQEDITSYPNGVSVEVPAGYVYVLGDNRNHSSDSRVIGLVPYENIIGKMIGQL